MQPVKMYCWIDRCSFQKHRVDGNFIQPFTHSVWLLGDFWHHTKNSFDVSWKTTMCVCLVAWSKQCVTLKIKWLMVFWRGIHDSALVCLELNNDGWMSTEQSFAGVDKIPSYYATFIILFINKYENLSF